MTKGFGAPTEIKTKKFWLAAFTQDNEDDPFMFAASYSDIFDPDNHNWFGLLLVSLLWPWFLVVCLFQRIIK